MIMKEIKWIEPGIVALHAARPFTELMGLFTLIYSHLVKGA